MISPRLLPIALAAFLLLPACKRQPIASAPPATSPAVDPVTLNNRGVGLMGRFEFEPARAVFADLLKSHDDPDVRVNLAIATLNRQQEGDSAEALRLVDAVLAAHSDHPRARYCRGILLLNGGQPAEALAAFRTVAQADPADAYARYYVGQCLLATGDRAGALAEYRKAIELDPQLRSASYGAFVCLQQLGKADEAKPYLDEFQRLKDNPRARLVEFKYSRMGSKSEVATIGPPTPPAPQPAGPLFADAAPLPITGATNLAWRTSVDADDVRPSITVADIDGDGQSDLFVTAAFGKDSALRNAVLLRRGDHFEIQPQHPLALVADVNAVLWGDFDNDGLPDVYLCRRGPNQLWRQTKPGEWQDVTASTKTAGGDFDTIDGAFVDADHDGDLDLILIRRNGPTELLSNNLDGTFRAIGQSSGLAGDGREAVGLVVADLDHDGDADVLVLKKDAPHDVFLNDRLWRYRKATGFDEFAKTPIAAAVAADTDVDGQVELYAASPQGINRWAPDRQGVWHASTLSSGASRTLAVADVGGAGALSLLHDAGDMWAVASLADGKTTFAPAMPHILAWRTAALDPANGPAVVALSNAGGPVVFRPGPGRFPFAALALTGKENKADQMRSNASGIGVTLAVRTGSRWSAATTYRASSGPGQSLEPVCLGLGGAPKADFVSMVWPDGLRQTELDVRAGALTKFAETQRQTSSCPVIFAWDGQRWAFVTDCLGVGGIGFALAPGEYAPERPWENILLPPNLLRPLDGQLRLKLTEPMEEACYLDRAALVAYDLPPGWWMTLDERMGVKDPQPTGEPRFYRESMTPSAATDDRGRDVTAKLAAADHVAVDPGEHDPRFVGFCRPHALGMTFPRPLDATPGDPTLIIDGWVEYPYSQTMFAAWQAGVAYEAPTLEARAPGGPWVVLLERFGYPAGMPRQMSVPIPRSKLPKGATELRLRTNQEIYFDRVAVAWAQPCRDARVTQTPLHAATLSETGFAKRLNFPQHRPGYDYATRAPLWDVTHQDGFYTAFGPVDDLLRQTDDALAIFGPGEEVDLAFKAPDTEPAAGWTRVWVLQLNGWCKDRDLYTKDGATLEPLPKSPTSTPEALRRRDAMHRQWNTRYRSGGGTR